jgi:Domain of unknown function (DUF4062)
MEKIYQVFVSSTYSDLQEERKAVSDTLAKAGFIPAGMELFPATDQQQLEFIKRVIDRCDYYVVVVGGRYGSLANENVSFTEKEYEYALERGIPVLAFLHKNPGQIEADKSELDVEARARLERFRSRLGASRVIDFWTTSQDLATRVLTAVVHNVNLSPGTGWIRGDQAVDPKVLQEMERVRIENSDLRKQLAAVQASELTFPANVPGPDEPFHCVVSVSRYEVSNVPWDRKLVKQEAFENSTTLAAIFPNLFDYLVTGTPEYRLSRAIGSVIAQLAGKDTKDLVFDIGTGEMREMRFRLEALGLIRTEADPTGGENIIWTITDKGRHYVTRSIVETQKLFDC